MNSKQTILKIFTSLSIEAGRLGFVNWDHWVSYNDNTTYAVIFRYCNPNNECDVELYLSSACPMQIALLIKGVSGWRSQPLTDYPPELRSLSDKQKHFLNWCSYCVTKIKDQPINDVEALIQETKATIYCCCLIKSCYKR